MQTLTATAFALVLGAAACNDEELLPPPPPAGLVDPLFARYVSMGNSITAGFQSGGINVTTQNQSYAVLLAEAMGTPFRAPLLGQPGCPRLYGNVFTQTRTPSVPGVPDNSSACLAVRTIEDDPLRPAYVNNVAVPGAEVIDLYDNLDPTSNPNGLTTLFLGGLTQTQMLERVAPTFVSIWIGNNDVLGAATNTANGGDSTLITPIATFQARYDAMLDSVDAVGPQGGVLIGVVKVTNASFFSAGATYWAIKNGFVPGAPALPDSFFVNNNCAPSGPLPGFPGGIPGARGDSVLVGFPYGGLLLGTAAAGVRATLSCSDAVPQILAPAEVVKLLSTIAQYNAHISAAATDRGWAYWDPNPTLDSLKALPPPFAIAPFPAFGAPCSANPFGTALSCDGVHPSASAHRLVANKVREVINTKYGTTIPAIP